MLAALALAGCTAPGAPPRGPAASLPAAPAKGLGVLPPQGAPVTGCMLYLYASGPGRLLVLSADSSNGTARIMLDGAVTALPFMAFEGAPRTGFSPRMSYGTARQRVELELDFDAGSEMRGGAAIESGSMRLDRDGADSVAFPVQGLIVCVGTP